MLSWENYWPDLLRERIKEAGAGGRNIHVYEGMADSIYHAFSLTAARWPGKTAVVDDKGQALTYGRLLDIWPPIKLAGWRFLSRESFRGRKSCLCWRKQMLQL